MTTPHLIPSVWVDDDVVVIHDRLDRDPGRVPLDLVEDAWKRANNSDSALAAVDGRRYRRDVLLMALDLVARQYPCSNPYHEGIDLPAFSADGLCSNCSTAFAAMESL